jgi:hypothetical protein
MSEEQTPGTEAVEPKMVPIPEASYEDLEAFIGSQEESEGQAADGEDGGSQKEEAAKQQPEAKTKGQEDNSKKEKEYLPDPKEIEMVSKKQYEKVLEQLQQQERFIQQRNQQLGEARKQITALRAEKAKVLDDAFAESPLKGLEAANEIKELDATIEEIDSEQERMTKTHTVQKAVANYIQPKDWSVEAMTDSLKRDGLSTEFISKFRTNPYGIEWGPEAALINLAKRARAEKALTVVIPLLKQFYERAKELKGKPQEMLKKINQASKQPAQVTASKAGTSSGSKYLPKDLTSLSDAELDAFLESN